MKRAFSILSMVSGLTIDFRLVKDKIQGDAFVSNFVRIFRELRIVA